MKKIIFFLVCMLLCQNVQAQTVYDDNYIENPNYLEGIKFVEKAQYSSAINEFRKAIRVNPLDSSSLIGLSNAYNLRAVYYNNTVKDYEKAISDLKSALFFIKYFPINSAEVASIESIQAIEKNLSSLETSHKIGLTPESRLETAKKSRIRGEFASAAFDYYQLSSNSKYAGEANSALGDIYKIFNRPEKAVTFYRNAIKFDSNDTESHLKLARTYEQVNDFQAALKEYSYALNTSNERDDILNSLEKIWQQKVDVNPKDAEAHANLGVVYQKQKRYNEALSEYQKAEALNPSNVNTRINIGTLYQEQKNYDKALNIYNSILQTQPQNVAVLTYKAECLKNLRRNEDAISTYKTALSIEPNNSNIKANLFDLLKTTMPTEKVLDYLYQNVKKEPMNANTYYEFAYELHKANKIDDAIVYYKETIKLDNTKIDAYTNLSQAYRQKGDFVNAYQTIQQAKTIAPTNEIVKKQNEIITKEYGANRYSIATNAFESGDYQTAINEYSKIKPATVDSYIGIAASYQALNDTKEAINYYKKAMGLDNKNSDLPFYIASIYANNNDLTNAKQYTEIALNKNPNHTKAKELSEYIDAKNLETLLSNAVKLYEEKNYKEAITEFNKVLQISPSNATVYYYRAMAFDGLNDYQKAISDYQQTLKYAPDMIIAYYSMGVDYDALNNFTAAKENYKIYVEKSVTDDDYRRYAQSRINEIQ